MVYNRDIILLLYMLRVISWKQDDNVLLKVYIENLIAISINYLGCFMMIEKLCERN